jgi:hypothetical protein
MKIKNKYISSVEDTDYQNYCLNHNLKEWEQNSGCAVLFCQVYADKNYEYEIDYFVIHKEDIENFMGMNDLDFTTLNTDKIFAEMCATGYINIFIN